ncbi:carbohydrate ABC transporter permease [Candidatus Aerophobetes bacterium]|nr:carbohydrate ABC transporter permease [Candidatus Aerophobetes bacterium]
MKINFRQKTIFNIPKYVGLLLLGFLAFYPLFFIIMTSFKSNQQFYLNFWTPTLPLYFENYIPALAIVGRCILNSAFYSGCNMAIVVMISALAGYAFAGYDFPGKEILFFSILALQMIPEVLLYIPLYSIMYQLKWMNQPQALLTHWSARSVVIGTLILRTSFASQPREIFEAARIEGAREHTIFFKMALPLALPALGTVAIVDLLFTWNDIMWPLLVIGEKQLKPLAVGLLAFRGAFYASYGVLFAGYALASFPLIIVFAFMVKKFLQGLKGGLEI